MTDGEFQTFANLLFTSFPDVWEYLQSFSPDPEATQGVWRSVLRAYPFDECIGVLDDWLTGARPIYRHYERAQIALVIRQSIQFDRDKRRQREQSNSQSLEYKKTRREDYQPIAQDVPSLGALLRDGQALGLALRMKKITQEEFEIARQAILKKVK